MDKEEITKQIVDKIKEHSFQLYSAREVLMDGNVQLSTVSKKENLIDIFELNAFLDELTKTPEGEV